MSRLTVFCAALLATTTLSTVALAQDANTTTTTTYESNSYYHWNPLDDQTTGLYLSGQAGGSWPINDLEDDGAYSGALGWQFTPLVRAEIEGAYRNNELDAGPGDADTWTWMVNAYWDFRNDSMITPYLGAGLGYAHQSIEAPGVDESDGTFVWQAIAGASFDLTPNWALTADYRYIDSNDFQYAAVGDADYQAHEVRGGLRYTF